MLPSSHVRYMILIRCAHMVIFTWDKKKTIFKFLFYYYYYFYVDFTTYFNRIHIYWIKLNELHYSFSFKKNCLC